ncbi:hypothetical protein WJX73_003737 [Symbiochloris irregularis]|uniref:Rad60/SUMO-like domain-containing protein n=1 Tax=Symbiochloris irregularis TaxID=706552 RepID=A0AAW1NPL0_9CHLO
MERRLFSVECMAQQSWQPTLSLWEEPGTLFTSLAPVSITLTSGKVLLKYSCVGKQVEAIVAGLGVQDVPVQVRRNGRLVKINKSTPANKRKAPAESVISSAPRIAPHTTAGSTDFKLRFIGPNPIGAEITFRVRPTTRMKHMMSIYAKNVSLDEKSLHFIYEGLRLWPEDTPDGLGMESEDKVDVGIEQVGC